MTDSPADDPYGYSGMPVMKSGVANPYLSDPGFEMDHEKVRDLGDGMGKRAPVMTELSGKIKAIQIHTFAFGAIGGGLNVAHTQVRDSAADAVEKGREVLESWKEALSKVAENTKEAEKAGAGKEPRKPKPSGTGGGKIPPFKGAGLGDLGKGPKGLGDLGENGLGGLGKQPPGFDDSFDPPGADDAPKPPDFDDSFDPPGSDDIPKPPGSDDIFDPPGSGDIPKPPGMEDVPKPPGFDPSQGDPGTAGNVDPPKLNGLDENALGKNALNDPLKTELSGYDPKLAGLNAPSNAFKAPEMSDLRSPGAEGVSTGSRIGTGTGSGIGGFSGANPGGAAGQGAGLGGRGLGSSGMPMMPLSPMGGGAGGEGDKDRERSTWLTEDEGVWGGDGDVAPPVIE
ncbi:hypothetical protein [Streptosporangium sp. 'caverna']|uniref:hypothetical protein n=1 Tax=Streptosporangium sp. 'caverna' TaxID=2202249 RepID=UPI0013A6C375|nr:hypothetical protein [Streptosporangium sp. 'caverna']